MLSKNSDLGLFQPILAPWYESLDNPSEAQQKTLLSLVDQYGKTAYGEVHHAPEVIDVQSFREYFPPMDYRVLNPYLTEIQKGNFRAILPEPLLCWVMTRGSTGPAKVLPVTKTHIEQIMLCGARALANYTMRTKDYDIFAGKILNLNFPSVVHAVTVNGNPMTFGYSSGTYAKLNPMLSTVSLLPKQEEIDALGAGISRLDWERRFELAYQRGANQNITATMGVTPVILGFARYVKRKHGKKPRDLWHFRALFCTSVRKIQFKYGPVLRKYFGDVPVVEMYTATEGVFAQQKDNLPYVTPNYDAYVFEVQTRSGPKMLHELKRGEWGKLIVSSCLFPRYRIGDVVESCGKDYFRVVGRDRFSVLLEHRLYRFFLGWLA